jgi:hypothetical protein
MKRFLVFVLFFSGCAVPQRTSQEAPPVSQALASPSNSRIFVYVPQTDDAAAQWIKWFDTYPQLRMVIAVSPRFSKLVKDVAIKSRIDALVKEGRLELALQIPNAPLLPLLLEKPPYGYPDDVVQLLAQSKAGFYKNWGALPRGLVLPYGAASPRLISLLERSGFSWVVGSFGLAPVEGPYQAGSVSFWDVTPKGTVQVWDERFAKEKPFQTWMNEITKQQRVCILPRESPAGTASLARTSVKMQTWDGSGLSLWIGDPAKNTAWEALRQSREALEKYKNSGRAALGRMDAAFSEIFSAQNSNYFASAGNVTQSPALVEERAHEFQASLSAVYRMIGEAVPEDLFSGATDSMPSLSKLSSTTISVETLADGSERVVIRDAMGDALMPNGDDFQSLEVRGSSDTLAWNFTWATLPAKATLDVYLDLNGQPGVGTTALLPGQPFVAAAKDAWEYALRISNQEATLYRTQGGGSFGVVQTFPVVSQGGSIAIFMPGGVLRGKISRWGYQVLSGQNPLADFVDPLEISQQELWQEHLRGNRHDLPFVKYK